LASLIFLDVILSEVAASRREAAMQSKDPYTLNTRCVTAAFSKL
jgi:hypothetical protein